MELEIYPTGEARNHDQDLPGLSPLSLMLPGEVPAHPARGREQEVLGEVFFKLSFPQIFTCRWILAPCHASLSPFTINQTLWSVILSLYPTHSKKIRSGKEWKSPAQQSRIHVFVYENKFYFVLLNPTFLNLHSPEVSQDRVSDTPNIEWLFIKGQRERTESGSVSTSQDALVIQSSFKQDTKC